MKSSVIKLALSLLVIIAIGLFAFNSTSQSESDVVIIRVAQAGGIVKSGMFIYDQTGVVEIVEMEKIKNQEMVDKNYVTIAQKLAEYRAKGYSIRSASDNVGNGTFLNTYVLEK